MTLREAEKLLLWGVCVLGGCAGTQPATKVVSSNTAVMTAPPAAAGNDVGCDPARDRAAILRMAGTFNIHFAFDETEVLAPDYVRHQPYRTDATEYVDVLESSEHHVVLQHVLMIQKHSGAYQPQKHWRQDWTFEDHDVLEFRGQRTWEHHTLSDAEAQCSWTQAVFEVDDGPRYESFGRFAYTGDADSGTATWTSQQTNRPLPRREYTHRSDYDVLLGLNRHVISAKGWLHEQDNVKLVQAGGKQLVRERGENRYERIELPEVAVAQDYLKRTGAFWGEVRSAWDAVLASATRVSVRSTVEGKLLYEQLFPLAESRKASAPDETRAQVRALLKPYVEEVAQPTAATASAR
jgi:hypothetical protein